MKNIKEIIIIKRFLVFGLILALFSLLILPNFASAAALTSMSDTQTRLKKNTATNSTIVFTTPSGVHVGDTITLTYQSDYTVTSVVLGDVTIGGNAPGSVTAVGQVITITADADTVVAPAGTATIVITNNHITNATTAGSYLLDIAGTFGDTGTLALAVADEDQVSISATVSPYISFNVTDNTVTLGTLDPTLIKNDTAAMTAATNNSSGYIIKISGGTLDDGAGHTITAIGGTKAASNPGNEQFGLNLVANTGFGSNPSGGIGAAAAQYNTTDMFAFLTGDTVASSAGASAVTTYTMSYIANIAYTTEPGTYTATHTYICTATF